MAIATAQPQTSYDEWRDRRWRLTGGLLGLLAVVVAALMVATGEKHSDYGDLLGAVADGEVSQVEVVGVGGRQWTGQRTVELRWSGMVNRYAEVVVVRSDDSAPSPPGQAATDGDPRDVLRTIDPEIQLTAGSYSTSSSSFMGWRLPGPVALAPMVVWFAVLLLLIGGPEPWRATRWAWGWFVLMGGPLGCVAYLLLGGPLGLWQPRNVSRRLTGGWAFLVAFVFLGGSNAG